MRLAPKRLLVPFARKRSWALEPNYRAIYLIKSIGLIGALVVGWLVYFFLAPETRVWSMTAFVLTSLVPSLAIALSERPPPVGLVWLTFILDVLGVTAAIHFGGGAQNVSGPMVYMIYTGLAGLLLSERGAIAVAALCGISYGVVIGSEFLGWLPRYPLPADYSPLARIAMVNGFAVLGAWVGAYTTQQMRLIYQRAEELRADAVSALSHDLKNPLNVVSGCAELLRDVVPPDQRNYVDLIERAAQDATDVVRNVLDAAILDDNGFSMTHGLVDVRDMLARTAGLYEFAAQLKSIEVRQSVQATLPPVHGDAQLLSRAVGNLVSNAIKYTRERGTIEIDAREEAGHVVIAVRDSGPGIPHEDQKQLFQKFSRTGDRRRVEGTGLGLYIVRRVAEVHGGKTDVESAVGAGSTFRIELPIPRSGAE